LENKGGPYETHVTWWTGTDLWNIYWTTRNNII